MPIFVGIDPGVNPVFALIDGNGCLIKFDRIVTRRFDLLTAIIPSIQEYMRMEDLARKLDRHINRWQTIRSTKVRFVFGLESLAFSASYKVALMSKIDYVLMCGILSKGYKLYSVSPGTWKKFAGGSGRASKDHVKDCLELKGYDLSNKSFDYSDALAIALTVRNMYEKEQSLGNKS